jgi:2-polyprenyl-3-methyl-5-hydroxy-6-metoxy-1,4-benzoquinol methylase
MKRLDLITWFDRLRKKWSEVPGGGHNRVKSHELLHLTDHELLDFWSESRHQDTTGERFAVRGWYHLLYKDVLCGKRVMDVGCGLGIDGITFAQNGARVTFVDIVESNLTVVHRLCDLLELTGVDFCYMEDISSLASLGVDYDAIWCQGSLINAPFSVIRAEAQELLKHLKPDGRWIELAYPKTRWEREGQLPFDRWGEKTDGEAPWIEWYDLHKVLAVLSPVKFDVVLYFNFDNDNFNWFDLIRKQ